MPRSFSILFFVLVASSCNNRFAAAPSVYNDTAYRQLWSADYRPDGRFIATGGVDSVLRIYNGKNLSPVKSIPLGSTIQVVRWNNDAVTLAVATVTRYVALINTKTGTTTWLDNSPGAPGTDNGSRAMSWHPDGNLLAVGGMDGLIRIWDKNGRLIRTINKYPPGTDYTGYLALDWHPSGTQFVAGNFEIVIYDTTGKTLSVMQHANPAAIILCARWHPSGGFFVVGDYGHNWEGENVPSLLHFWSKEGQLLKTIKSSNGEYRSIAWSPDGKYLATASDVLRIWNKDGTLVHQSPSDGSNYLWGISWHPSGKNIVTTSRHRSITRWTATAKNKKRIWVK